MARSRLSNTSVYAVSRRRKIGLIGATDVRESGTKNLQKFVEPRSLSCFVAQVFFWYKFLAQNRTQLYSVQETCIKLHARDETCAVCMRQKIDERGLPSNQSLIAR